MDFPKLKIILFLQRYDFEYNPCLTTTKIATCVHSFKYSNLKPMHWHHEQCRTSDYEATGFDSTNISRPSESDILRLLWLLTPSFVPFFFLPFLCFFRLPFLPFFLNSLRFCLPFTLLSNVSLDYTTLRWCPGLIHFVFAVATEAAVREEDYRIYLVVLDTPLTYLTSSWSVSARQRLLCRKYAHRSYMLISQADWVHMSLVTDVATEISRLGLIASVSSCGRWEALTCDHGSVYEMTRAASIWKEAGIVPTWRLMLFCRSSLSQDMPWEAWTHDQ